MKRKLTIKNDNIPTTYEMDGLFTQKDIDDRYRVMMQCRDCAKWTEQNIEHGMHSKYKPCNNCGGTSLDYTSAKSLRTFNILVDAKRKPKK